MFGFEVPETVAGVAPEVLDPRRTWADTAAYDDRAGKLAEMFTANFRNFADGVGEDVKAAGPVLSVEA